VTPTQAEMDLVLGATYEVRAALKHVVGPGWWLAVRVDDDGETSIGTVLHGGPDSFDMCSGCLVGRDHHVQARGEPMRWNDFEGRLERCGEWIRPPWVPVDPTAILAEAAKRAGSWAGVFAEPDGNGWTAWCHSGVGGHGKTARLAALRLFVEVVRG